MYRDSKTSETEFRLVYCHLKVDMKQDSNWDVIGPRKHVLLSGG
jgi:hypothetical protein